MPGVRFPALQLPLAASKLPGPVEDQLAKPAGRVTTTGTYVAVAGPALCKVTSKWAVSPGSRGDGA